MKYILRAMALCIIFSLFALASATSTTHIWAPSTDVQAFKLWHITSDVYIASKTDGIGNRLPSITNIGLTVGVLPFKKVNMEIGFDYKSGLGIADNYPLYGNFKIGIPENAFGNISPAVAVGGFDIGTKKDITNYDVFYGKIAKTFSTNKFSFGRLSLGYYQGNKKLLLDAKGEKYNSGLLLAWERTINEVSDKLWVCAEYMGAKNVYGSFNLGMSWKFAPNVAVLGGYQFYNNSKIVDTATLQVDIDI
jgi:hypothetical protein